MEGSFDRAKKYCRELGKVLGSKRKNQKNLKVLKHLRRGLVQIMSYPKLIDIILTRYRKK